jgi:hypothetical protein
MTSTGLSSPADGAVPEAREERGPSSLAKQQWTRDAFDPAMAWPVNYYNKIIKQRRIRSCKLQRPGSRDVLTNPGYVYRLLANVCGVAWNSTCLEIRLRTEFYGFGSWMRIANRDMENVSAQCKLVVRTDFF